MKQILLSAATMLMVSLNAQVGINTTEPEATLDVNGNVRVQNLKPNDSAEKVLTVDAKNIITATPITTLRANGGAAHGISSVNVLNLGKTYTCSKKNYNTIVFLTTGYMRCIADPKSNNAYAWAYGGVVYGGSRGIYTQSETTLKSGGYVGNPLSGINTFTSGAFARFGDFTYTPPVHVIDDSQYKD